MVSMTRYLYSSFHTERWLSRRRRWLSTVLSTDRYCRRRNYGRWVGLYFAFSEAAPSPHVHDGSRCYDAFSHRSRLLTQTFTEDAFTPEFDMGRIHDGLDRFASR